MSNKRQKLNKNEELNYDNLKSKIQYGEHSEKFTLDEVKKYVESHFDEIPIEIKSLFLHKYLEQGGKDWFDDAPIIGSSTVANVINEGYDKKNGRNNEFLLRTNQIPRQPESDSTRNGTIKEPFVAKKIADKYDLILFKLGRIKWNQNKEIGVSPDRVSFKDGVGINIEIKAPFRYRVYEDEDVEFLKDNFIYYYHQIQLQMLVLNLKKTIFVRYGGPPNKNHCDHILKHEVTSFVEVEFDPNWWPTYKNLIESFIGDVLKYRLKNPDWSKKKWTTEESIDFYKK